MANRSQGATAAAAAAGDDDNDAIICLDGTGPATDDDLHSLFTYTPTKGEILDALKSTKIVGKMDVKKRELASVGVGPIRASILEKLDDNDKKSFEMALPLKRVGQQHELKLSNTAAVSTSWFTVSDILGRLVSDDSKWPYSTTASNELRSKLVAASKQFKDAVEAAKTQVLSEKQAKVKAASVKLSLSELPTTVGYGQGDWVVPADPANGRCAFCKHVSIDTPKDAAQRQQRNVDKTLQYAAAKKAFEEAKASNPGATRESAKGGKTSRAPPKPTMEPLTARCCCRAFHRVKNGSDEGTTCPILCVNQDTQEAYKDDGPDGTECPYCRCQCAAAYDMTKMHTIAVSLELSQGGKAPSMMARSMAIQNSAGAVGAILSNAASAAAKNVAHRPPFQTANQSPQELQQETAQLQAEIAATGIAKTMGMDQHHPWLQEARQTIAPNGLTSAYQLPGGEFVDARAFATSRATHREATNSLNLKNPAKVPHKTSATKRKSKPKNYHPFGKPPVATTTTSSTSKTYSLNGKGGTSFSFPAIQVNQQTTVSSTMASATVDLTSSPAKPKEPDSIGQYQAVGSSSTISTSAKYTPRTDMKKRSLTKLTEASQRKVESYDAEKNGEPIYKEESEEEIQKRKKSKAVLSACLKKENKGLLDHIIEDGIENGGIEDSQQMVYKLHDIMGED